MMASKRTGSSTTAAQSGDGDNIQVFVRVRPADCESSYTKGVTVDDNKTTIYLEAKSKPKTFRFDYVAKEDITQETVFNILGRKLIDSCLDGYNGTIFAYGQTGSGKTFTMLGPAEDSENFHHQLRGVIPRSFEYLFSCINKEKEMHGDEKQYLCRCSFLEIYNEQIFDLLEPSSTQLQLRESFKTGVYVNGISEQVVKSASEAYGEKTGAVDHIKTSMLNLVDLAGSERQKDTGAVGARLREAGQINKSLSNLGNVIMSLVATSSGGKERYIPYRDSKLTFLLKDSLGGNAKTRLVACVHPGAKCYGETLSTLQFASRAKLIKNKAVLNEDSKGNIQALQQEIRQLKEALVRCQNEAPSNQTVIADDVLVNSLKEMFVQAMMLQQRTQVEKLNLEEKNRRLKDICAKKDHFLQASKMVVKFRVADISRLKAELAEKPQETNEHIDSLQKEVDLLRSQVEQHPDIAQYRMENQCLKNALQANRAENLSNAQADKLRIKQLENKFRELLAEQEEEDKAENGEEVKPATPKPDVNEALEKYKSIVEKVQTENSELKQSLTETKQSAEKKEMDLKSELDAAEKYVIELEKVLSANNMKNKLERDALNEQHLKQVQTIATPKKERYRLRNRTIISAGNDTPDLNDTIPYEDEIMAEKELGNDMIEQANEALIEQIKELQSQSSELNRKLQEKDSELVKHIQTASKLDSKLQQMDELLMKEKTMNQELEVSAKIQEQKIQQLNQDCDYANGEVRDLRIVLASADRKVDEYKKKYIELKERCEKENNQIQAKMIDIQLKVEQLSTENEELMQVKESLTNNLETEVQTVWYQNTMIQNLEEKLATQTSQLAELELNLQIAEKTILDEQEHTNTLLNQIRAEGIEKEDMLRKISDLKTLQMELDATKNLNDGQEQTIGLLRKELDCRENKISSLEKRINQDEEKMRDQFDKLEANRLVTDELRQRLINMEEENNSQIILRLEQTEAIIALRQQLEEIGKKYELSCQRHEVEMSMASEDVMSITENYNDEVKRQQEATAFCGQLKAENEELKRKLQDLTESMKESSQQTEREYEINHLMRQVDELHSIGKRRNEENNELRVKLQEHSKLTDRLLEEKDEQYKKLMEKHQEDQEQKDRLTQELQTMTQELSIMQKDLEKVSQENTVLIGQHNTKQRIHYHEKLKKELDITRRQLAYISAQKENKPPPHQFLSGDYVIKH